jgi:hypothetical protein
VSPHGEKSRANGRSSRPHPTPFRSPTHLATVSRSRRTARTSSSPYKTSSSPCSSSTSPVEASARISRSLSAHRRAGTPARSSRAWR